MTSSMVNAIVNRYSDFTGTEQIIADFFISNASPEGLQISSVAERLFVSKASLTRFAIKMGFRGYREFVCQYEKSLVADYGGVPLSHVLESYKGIIREMESGYSEEQLEDICRLIENAEKILVIGIGSSGLAAREFQSRLVRLGENCSSCDERDLMKIQSTLQDEKSLVIGISLSGQTSDVIYSLKLAALHRAQTVLITGVRQELPFLSHQVVVPTIQGIDAGDFISPQIPILFYSDLLYNKYIDLHRNKLSFHERTMEALGRKTPSKVK